VIYRQKGFDGSPEVFIDPNALNAEGTTSIGLTGFSESDKYVAYSRSDAGSDWQNIMVKEVATGNELSDTLRWVKFSGASWVGDEGFFYSRYPAPEEGAELSGNNQYHSVYYHALGTGQAEDKLIWEDRDKPYMYHFGGVTEDKRYFVMYAAPGTDGYATYLLDLQQSIGSTKPKLLFEGYKNKSTVVDHANGELLVLTDLDAPNYRCVRVNPNKPDPKNWVDVIPERTHLLESVSTAGGGLTATYLEKAANQVYRFNYDGTGEQKVGLPGIGSVGGFGGKKEDKETFYTFTSFVYPPTIFKYDWASGESEIFYETELKFNPTDYVEKQVTYKSKDGTPVTMFIVMLKNKQNVFDDFISAAEYLVAEGYTNSDKLAIAGGSNGGLLVGACMTQRPDLFAVAFPAVGVMDMLRYHKFTVGKGWIPEYGSADDPEMFPVLKAYSPLHNLKDGTTYPSTMVTTADHDDRVVPAHSFKFAARLQEAHVGENPVLIRIETNAGHGAGKPTSKIIDEQADLWSFFFQETGSVPRYGKG